MSEPRALARPKILGLEIIDCENGYIVLTGSGLNGDQPYHRFRKKYVAHTPQALADLVKSLAESGEATGEGK